jgi:hypothetical protein
MDLASKGGCIAQLVEQLTLNQRVTGSSPVTPTKLINGLRVRPLLAFIANL